MYNNNDFGDFFNSLFESETLTADNYREKLDDYWRRCKMDLYFSTLSAAKQTYKVLRNSKGEHRVEKR